MSDGMRLLKSACASNLQIVPMTKKAQSAGGATHSFGFIAVLGIIFASALTSAADEAELLKVWSKPDISVREKSAAVNHAFTNGTPIRAIVKVLGTNFMVSGSSAAVSTEPGWKPPLWLAYRFGNDSVDIETDVHFGGDALTGKFTGAGYSWTRRHSDDSTNRIWIGPKEGAPKEKQPSQPETNRTPSAASRN